MTVLIGVQDKVVLHIIIIIIITERWRVDYATKIIIFVVAHSSPTLPLDNEVTSLLNTIYVVIVSPPLITARTVKVYLDAHNAKTSITVYCT